MVLQSLNLKINHPIAIEGASVAQSSDFHLCDRGFDSRYGLTRKESVNALLKVVGFLRVLRFPPTGKVNRVG